MGSQRLRRGWTMPEKIYDAIVVGSGITGGWAAKELTEKGLNTLVLEAGRSITPDVDYIEMVPVWQGPFRGLRDRKRLAEEQPIQRLGGGCGAWGTKFFESGKENPYSTEPDKPCLWIRRPPAGRPVIHVGRPCRRLSWPRLEADPP